MRTLNQALAEARKRWGPKAVVEATKCAHFKQSPREVKEGRPPLCSGVGSHPQPCPGRRPLFKVGRLLMVFFEVKGDGLTWGEAFARAAAGDHKGLCGQRLHKLKCDECDRLDAEVLREAAQAGAEAKP